MSPAAVARLNDATSPVSVPNYSQDLWNETADRKTKIALRAASDEVIATALTAIKTGLPKKIVELTHLIHRAETDQGSIFHASWDSRWIPQKPQSPTTTICSSVAVMDISTTSHPAPLRGEPGGGSPTSTMRRISISQQHGPSDLSLSPSISVFRPPAHILQLWEALEAHIRHIVQLLDSIQMYLILKTPIAEEGNNTGVEIQQQCSRTLLEARRFVVGCSGYLKMYHTQRAKIASKCLKYPQLEDYQRALVERDNEECRDSRYLLVRLRVQCLAVADILHKNFEKVDDPKGLVRGGVSIGMY